MNYHESPNQRAATPGNRPKLLLQLVTVCLSAALVAGVAIAYTATPREKTGQATTRPVVEKSNKPVEPVPEKTDEPDKPVVLPKKLPQLDNTPDYVPEKSSAEKELEEKITLLRQSLQTSFDKRDYKAVVNMASQLEKLSRRKSEVDKSGQLKRFASIMVDVEKLVENARTERALELLWREAADAPEDEWREIARKRLEALNRTETEAGAMYESAVSRLDRGHNSSGQLLLKKIIQKHPHSTWADQARQKLAQILSETKDKE